MTSDLTEGSGGGAKKTGCFPFEEELTDSVECLIVLGLKEEVLVDPQDRLNGDFEEMKC